MQQYLRLAYCKLTKQSISESVVYSILFLILFYTRIA